MTQPRGTSPLSCPFKALTPTLLSPIPSYPSTPVCMSVFGPLLSQLPWLTFSQQT
jgi:hypothetical protein